MKFIDEAIITVEAGHGGGGCVSFRREKFISHGGPDGGDGGKGGDIILRATSRKRTLYQFRFKRQFTAQNGSGGAGQQRAGKKGEDLILEVPPGTLVTNVETGEILKDFTLPEEDFVLARGGRGGQGNTRFKSSTHKTPRFAQPGEPGEAFSLKLELKLLADVGIMGLPNAGKSTLIQAITSARPKIGNYPFTTLTPNLGVVQTGWGEPFVVADIPGLIEGAHEGAGLGTQFLKHIERTRILVHLVDASVLDPEDPLRDLNIINRELFLYNPKLAEKPQIVVLNKLDLDQAEENAAKFESLFTDDEVLRISAKDGQGLEKLMSKIVQRLDDSNG
ncbi:MAG: GTPase ObgE [Desulfobacteraceae bacterium]|nr:GTPase ObgE [Desulfobacteraceae bacterium]MBU4055637.1 GTPase ObgE [Pseudomonadota bacterium]